MLTEFNNAFSAFGFAGLFTQTAFWAFFYTVGVFLIAVSTALFIIKGFALRRIAKNRYLPYSVLAFVPLGQLFLIGEIGDYYFKRGGKNYNLALINLILGAIALVFRLISFHGFFGVMGGLAAAAFTVVSIICEFQFLREVVPGRAVILTILGIIVPIASPIILFTQRDKTDAPQQFINVTAEDSDN